MMWRVLNNRHGLALMFIVFFERRDNFKIIIENLDFYPRDAMLARVIEIATCLSVCLSVCHAPVLCQNEES